MELNDHVCAVIKCSRCLDDESAGRYVDAASLPVPWFGDIAGAEVVTIGINPARGEFYTKALAKLAETVISHFLKNPETQSVSAFWQRALRNFDTVNAKNDCG